MTQGFDTSMISLKKWVNFKTVLTMSAEIEMFMSLMRYEMPKIFKYNFDWGKLSALTLSKSTTFTFLIYFLIVLRSKVEATLLVVIVRPLLSAWIKSAIMSDLIFLSVLLMLATCLLESFMIFSKLFILIRTSTCFLDELFVIILSCDLFFLGLFKALWISSIFFVEKFEKLSLILMMLLIVLFKAWA